MSTKGSVKEDDPVLKVRAHNLLKQNYIEILGSWIRHSLVKFWVSYIQKWKQELKVILLWARVGVNWKG